MNKKQIPELVHLEKKSVQNGMFNSKNSYQNFI